MKRRTFSYDKVSAQVYPHFLPYQNIEEARAAIPRIAEKLHLSVKSVGGFLTQTQLNPKVAASLHAQGYTSRQIPAWFAPADHANATIEPTQSLSATETLQRRDGAQEPSTSTFNPAPSNHERDQGPILYRIPEEDHAEKDISYIGRRLDGATRPVIIDPGIDYSQVPLDKGPWFERNPNGGLPTIYVPLWKELTGGTVRNKTGSEYPWRETAPEVESKEEELAQEPAKENRDAEWNMFFWAWIFQRNAEQASKRELREQLNNFIKEVTKAPQKEEETKPPPTNVGYEERGKTLASMFKPALPVSMQITEVRAHE